MESSPFELVFLSLIVAVLVGMGLYYGRRQLQILRDSHAPESLDAADLRYYRAQAWRRLINSGLMLVLAGLLAGTYVIGQERQVIEIGRASAPGETSSAAVPKAERERFVSQYSVYWIVTVLVLLVIVGLAFVDLWSIRRFGQRHYRQIQSDRREVIRQEIARLRSQRNGH